jgi:hypothetical protein
MALYKGHPKFLHSHFPEHVYSQYLSNTCEEPRAVYVLRRKSKNSHRNPVYSVDGKTVFLEDLGSCVPAWKNPSRTQGYKWDLIKVRERKIQREHGGAQIESAGRESMLFFFRCF